MVLPLLWAWWREVLFLFGRERSCRFLHCVSMPCRALSWRERWGLRCGTRGEDCGVAREVARGQGGSVQTVLGKLYENDYAGQTVREWLRGGNCTRTIMRGGYAGRQCTNYAVQTARRKLCWGDCVGDLCFRSVYWSTDIAKVCIWRCINVAVCLQTRTDFS